MNLNLLNDKQVAQLEELLAACSRIVITCHKSPDGDALGSSLAWAEFLKAKGKQPAVIIPDAFPDFLRWMPNTEKVIRYDKHQEQADALLREAELIFCLDFNESSRLDEMQSAFDAAQARRVMIDHHLNPNLHAELTVSDPELSSTAELVFRIIWQMGGFEEMNKHCAVCLYCGMMTDTGAFTYNSSRPEIFIIIGQLLTKHIDKDKIYRNVYNNFSAWAIRLRGYLMSQKLNVFDDVHAAFFTISRQDMRRFHFIKGDAEGLVNEPLRIKGMKLSVSLREDDRRDNLVWVSLRSVGQFPCNEVAERFFNGGGHLNASGGRLLCSLEEAEKTVRQAFAEYAEILKKG